VAGVPLGTYAGRTADTAICRTGGADATGACPGINGAHWRIGLATSRDGINWTRVLGTATGGAILDNGVAGHFDSFLTYRPHVLKDGSVYRMWYNGSDAPFNCPNGALTQNRRIGYAESRDGITWLRRDNAFGLLPSDEGWDSEMTCYPAVIPLERDRLLMFYNGNGYGRSGVGAAVLDA